MDNIRIFESEKFGTIRTVSREDGPWFVAADVCKALDIGNPSDALGRLDDDEKALVSIEGISRGNDKANIISEPGLYALVLSSRKPEAKAFKRWITHEVIPAIRKTGSYSTSTSAFEVNRLSLAEQNEALAAALGMTVAVRSRQSALDRPLTPEGAARILSGVRLAEALPLVRAALVGAGIDLPEIELIPRNPNRCKYTICIKEKKPVVNYEELAQAVGRGLARHVITEFDLSELAELPVRSVVRWIYGQQQLTIQNLACLDEGLRRNYPSLYDPEF